MISRLKLPSPLNKLYLTKPVPLNYNDVIWEKDITLRFRDANVYGFIVLLGKGGYKQPGIRLLRNNRVIEGTTIHRNIPEFLFGTKNKYAPQRVYGELHLNHCPVNYQKMAFDVDLGPLYVELKKVLSKPDNFNFIGTAEEYRARKDKKVPQNKKRASPNKIKPSPLIQEKLSEIGNDKFLKLYNSLCGISLKEHPVLAYVGAWSFFDSLVTAIVEKRTGSFVDFFKPKIAKWWENDRGKKSEIKLTLEDIHRRGNCCKHSDKYQVHDAIQLKSDFRVLEDFIVRCVEELP